MAYEKQTCVECEDKLLARDGVIPQHHRRGTIIPCEGSGLFSIEHDEATKNEGTDMQPKTFDLNKVEELAAQGVTMGAAQKALETSDMTFRKNLRTNPEFKAAWERGLARAKNGTSPRTQPSRRAPKPKRAANNDRAKTDSAQTESNPPPVDAQLGRAVAAAYTELTYFRCWGVPSPKFDDTLDMLASLAPQDGARSAL